MQRSSSALAGDAPMSVEEKFEAEESNTHPALLGRLPLISASWSFWRYPGHGLWLKSLLQHMFRWDHQKRLPAPPAPGKSARLGELLRAPSV